MTNATTPIPMRSLFDRMSSIRQATPQLSKELRSIAAEMPASKTRQQMQRLADALDADRSSASIAESFPKLAWILTLNSSAATTDALSGILEHATYQNALRNKRLRSVAYPVGILLLAVGLVLVACATIVPIFDEMFQEFELRLPAQTAALMQISRFVTQHPIATVVMLALAVAVLAGVIWSWAENGLVKQILFGRTQDLAKARHALAKACTQLAELTDDGVSAEESLRITAESSTDPTTRIALAELASTVGQSPEKISLSRAATFLPGNFLLAIQPDPSEGTLQPNTTMLRALSCNYRDLSIDRKDWSTFVLAQMALIFVGVAIGFIVIALFAPLVSLVTSLSS